MKVLLVSSFFLCSFFAAAQQNPNSTEIDFRIKKHYSAEQLQEILQNYPVKIKQLNYYFQKSYTILGPKISKEIDLDKFDVMDYEKYRKENERVIIGLTREGHLLELLSITELKAKYNEL